MTDQQIRRLAIKFRKAIDAAQSDGRFDRDVCFKDFPSGCCGDTSDLMAEYLRKHGVETIWCSMQRDDYSHAWLVVKDERVKTPTHETFAYPKEMSSVLVSYGMEHPEDEIDISRYKDADLRNGLIIDITADQFEDYDISVYVGYQDSFHQSFEFIQALDCDRLCEGRLRRLYSVIEEYIG